jgi:putative nucleotidyltransferase with HDIG domain
VGAMIEKKDIIDSFRDLRLMKDKVLQEKIVLAWKLAVDRGQWQRLADIPFTLLMEDSGMLVEHTKRVVNMAWNVGNSRSEKLNKDFLLAGAFLHDVGKPLEYQLKDGKVIKSEFGAKVRHPESGARLAEECGLPKEVVHIIAAHSHEGDTMNRTPEAVIVNHCDFIDFEIIKRLKE